MTQKLTGILLSCLVAAAPLAQAADSYLLEANYSNEALQASTTSLETAVQPASSPSIFQASQDFLSGGVLSAAILPSPVETNFISQQSNGIYNVKLDAYFKELFRQVMPSSATAGFDPLELVNVEFEILGQRIYESLANLYDFVVIVPTTSARAQLTNLNFAASQGAEGFGSAVKDNIQGLGDLASDDALIQRLNQTFGPLLEKSTSSFMDAVNDQSILQGASWIDLNQISADLSGSGLSLSNYNRFVALQEVAHRWGMFLSATAANSNPLGILGRDNSHWSPFFDAGTSPLDGMDWRDNGDGTFTLQSFFGISISDLFSGNGNGQSNQYNDFDLYAMGLLSSSQVNSSFVIDQPRTLSGSSLTMDSFYNLLGDINFLLNPTIRGSRHTISISDITALSGNRNPAAANSQKNFSVAFVSLESGTESSSTLTSQHNQVAALASSFVNGWASATRNLSTMTLGALSGAFTSFKNNVLQVFDGKISAVQQNKTQALNQKVTQAQQDQSTITGLRNQITQIESLLQPLSFRAQNDGLLAQALAPLSARVAALKLSIGNYNVQIQNPLNAAAGLPEFVSVKRSNLASLVDGAFSSGILPLGFAAAADNSIVSVENQYTTVTQNLETITQDFESHLAAYSAELNQIQAVLGPDHTAPAGSLLINDGAAKTAQGLLNLKLNFTDSQLGLYLMRYSTTGGADWSAFQPYGTDWQIGEWHAQGTHLNVLVQVCDFFWNCSSAASQIEYDYQDAAAPTGNFTINQGSSTASDGRLVLDFNFQDAQTPIAGIRYSTDLNQPWSAWSQSGKAALEVWPSQGTSFGVWVQACDYAWNCKTEFQSILFQYQDSLPPSGSLAINGGDARTSGNALTLNLQFEEHETFLGQMRYSKDRGQTWSAFRTYSSIWQILDLAPEILVQVCDVAWNCSTAVDSIEIDTSSEVIPA